MSDNDDLWTMPFGGEIPWQVVDDFLSLRVREHERLEYRERVDLNGPRDRFIDAVAAMANNGGTGLILIGGRPRTGLGPGDSGPLTTTPHSR